MLSGGARLLLDGGTRDAGAQAREPVQTVDIGLGAGFDDIGGSAASNHFAAGIFQLNGDLSHGFGAAGHSANLIALELGGGAGHLRNCPAKGVYRTVSDGRAFFGAVLESHPYGRPRNRRRATVDMQVLQFKGGRHGVDLVMQNGHEILIEHFLLLVGHNQESPVRLIQLLLGERVSQLSEAIQQSVAPRAGGEHDAALPHAHILGTHDFVGLALFEESVHMDSGAVRKRVGANHCLVGWNLDAQQVGHQPAGSIELAGIDAGMHAEVVRARAQGHHNLFQRGVAGPFAESVDSALHLPRAVEHTSQRVGHRHAKIVMAVHADHGPLAPGHVFPYAANQRSVLFRHGVAGGVGNIDDAGSGGDDGANHFKQVVRLGAPGVFGVKLDVVGELPRQGHGIDRHLQDVPLLFGQRLAVPVVPELAADVNVRGADSRVDAGPLALGQRLAAGFDVGGHGTGQRADRRSLDLPADPLHGLEILGRRVRITSLDHVHVQQRQLPGDDQFLTASQARSGSLFAVSQCGVEYRYFVRHRMARLPAHPSRAACHNRDDHARFAFSLEWILKRISPALGISLGFVLVGLPFLGLPGLHVDASSELACFYPCSHPAFRPSVLGFEVPLMVLSYLGAFKAWLYQPLLLSLQVTPFVLRLPLLLIGAATVWMFFALLHRTVGRHAAIAGTLLLATDSSFVVSTAIDFGPIVFLHFFLLAGVLLLLRFERTQSPKLLALAFLLFGLALWHKVLFIWMLVALSAATLAVFPHRVRMQFSLRRLGLAVLFLCLGASPLLFYNVVTGGHTLHTGDVMSAKVQVSEKLLQLKKTLDGSALLGFVTDETWKPKYTRQPSGLLATVSVRLNYAVGGLLRDWMLYAFLASCLLLPWL